MYKKQIPASIKELLAGKSYQKDSMGLSESTVLLFDDMVLKIQQTNKEIKNEYSIMKWLEQSEKLPHVLAYEQQEQQSYLLMSKMQGELSCDKQYMTRPEVLFRIVTEGMKWLWSVDISDCPCNNTLAHKLKQAEFQVTHGLVDLENTEPETFSENGFANPEALLQWLYENQPKEELVLSHGDYCLPNIFAKEDAFCGFVDVGRMGIADKWQDIALCYRSLAHNFAGKYNGISYGTFDASLFFEMLGVEPDWKKIRYYILLDELF